MGRTQPNSACSDHEIRKAHRALEQEFRKFVLDDLRIDTLPPGGDWKERPRSETIEFNLLHKAGIQQYAKRRGGGSTPVVVLREPAVFAADIALWVSWFETWIARGGRRFDLLDCSLSYYAGYPRDSHKMPLLRAEWQEFTDRGIKAAQPHWHFELPSSSEFSPAFLNALSGQGGVVESGDRGLGMSELGWRSDPSTAGVSISPLHLGMAGWTNPANAAAMEPARWQRHLTQPLQDLVEWATRATAYVCQQLQNYPPTIS